MWALHLQQHWSTPGNINLHAHRYICVCVYISIAIRSLTILSVTTHTNTLVSALIISNPEPAFQLLQLTTLFVNLDHASPY